MDALAEDLTLVRSTCALEGEFAWLGADAELDQQWESALSEGASLPSRAPSFSLNLAKGVSLLVRYNSPSTADFSASITAPSVDRDYQSALNAELDALVGALAKEDSPEYALFSLVSALREWLTAHSASTPSPAPPPAPLAQAQQTTLRLKVTLLWSHHLLATSKRKDIIAHSHSLHLWGLSKPGYPGVICVEGVDDRVDEFVRIVKSWQWKALQVRAEIMGEEVELPAGLSEKEGVEFAVGRAKLGKVLGGERVGVHEVEDMGQVGELMRQAGLEDVFLSALKLAK